MAQTTSNGLAVGNRVVGDATTRSFGRTGTITRVIDADGVLGGLVEVQWDGESQPHPDAGFEGANALKFVDCGCPTRDATIGTMSGARGAEAAVGFVGDDDRPHHTGRGRSVPGTDRRFERYFDVDLGNSMLSPAFRKFQRIARDAAREARG